jgi:hypothetical protein
MTKKQQRWARYYARHKRLILARNRTYKHSLKGRAVQRAAQSRFNHSTKGRTAQARYKQSTKGRAAQKAQRNSPQRRTARRAWMRSLNGRAHAAACCARQTAKRHNTIGSWTGVQFLALCKKYGNRCLCCHKKRRPTPDHVIPFCKGGTNHFSNIQPLCLPCNVKKGNSTTDYRKVKCLEPRPSTRKVRAKQ